MNAMVLACLLLAGLLLNGLGVLLVLRAVERHEDAQRDDMESQIVDHVLTRQADLAQYRAELHLDHQALRRDLLRRMGGWN